MKKGEATVLQWLLDLLQTQVLIQLTLSAIIVVGAYLVNRFVFQRAVNRFARRMGLEKKHINPIRNLASLLVFVTVAVLILWVFQIREAFFGILAATGFAGIVIGLATRDIISDLLVGILLLIYQPFEIGDAVSIGDVGGEVRDISLRGVTLNAWSGETIVIPNSMVRASIVKNYAVDKRRCDISFFVDYASDFAKALEVCKKVLKETPEALEEPTPTIRVDDFQEKYIKILILVWFPNEKYWDGYTEVKRKIAEAFRKEELEPPQLRVSTAGQKSPAN